jgi:hypothetical protein
MAAQWLPWAQVSGATSPGSDSAVCAVSGRVYPKREMLEYQGQWVGNEHKDVFFQRIREGLPVGAAGEMRYAGFQRRGRVALRAGRISCRADLGDDSRFGKRRSRPVHLFCDHAFADGFFPVVRTHGEDVRAW